jgi:hypothetical protein
MKTKLSVSLVPKSNIGATLRGAAIGSLLGVFALTSAHAGAVKVAGVPATTGATFDVTQVTYVSSDTTGTPLATTTTAVAMKGDTANGYAQLGGLGGGGAAQSCTLAAAGTDSAGGTFLGWSSPGGSAFATTGDAHVIAIYTSMLKANNTYLATYSDPSAPSTATTTTINAPSITYGANGSVTVTVANATGTPTGDVTLTVDGGGTPLGPQTLSAGSYTFTLTLPNAGSHSLSASFTPSSASFDASSGTGSLTVNKADATFTVTPYSVPYDGSAHTAGVSTITGVNSETGATVGAVTLSTTHSDAGTYNTDSWSFTGTANYNDISATTITDSIAKVDANFTVTPYVDVPYDGSAHTAEVSAITGVNGETGTTVGTVNLSNTTHSDAGTYNTDSWSFTGGTNYNDISATPITDSIGKATATVVVAPCSVTYDGNAHTATVTSITGVNGETGATVGTVNLSNTTHTPAGTYDEDSWSFTGAANYNDISATTITDSIGKSPTSIGVTVDPTTRQYSDRVTFTATVSPGTGSLAEMSGTVVFKVDEQVMGDPVSIETDHGTAQLKDVALLETLPLAMSPGPAVVTAEFTNGESSSSNYADATSPDTTILTITPEDAIATYTGPSFVATTDPLNGTTANVTLSATVQDITATADPAYDPDAGDITKATVTFVVDGQGGPSLTVPVGLVNNADSKVGTATLNVTLGLGDHTVKVTIGGYYKNAASNDGNGVLEVAQTGPGMITGGGYLIATNSSGIKPAAPGSKNNFGFNVQNTSKGAKGLKGSFNTIVRNGGNVYQIKGNSMTSLTVKNNTAAFACKANIQDITDPQNVLPIDGNATLQVTLTDNGEPGKSDTIGLALYNKDGGLWFSSNWNGLKTVEQIIANGNLVVHGGGSTGGNGKNQL